VSESIAESLSTIGLVAGFPLLLLCFMLSLEKLESWGLRDVETSADEAEGDKIEAAMDAVDRLATAPLRTDDEHLDAHPPVVAHHAAGRPTGHASGP
jgi:type III secretory pathway component EscV